MAKVIVAKNPGTCGICGKKYLAGTRIAKDDKTEKWCEADCLFPQFSKTPKPQAPSSGMADNGKVPTREIPGAKFTLMIDKAMEEAIDERARRRLRRARQIVDSEFKDADYSLYAPLLGAVYASLYGEEASIRIEKSRERRL